MGMGWEVEVEWGSRKRNRPGRARNGVGVCREVEVPSPGAMLCCACLLMRCLLHLVRQSSRFCSKLLLVRCLALLDLALPNQRLLTCRLLTLTLILTLALIQRGQRRRWHCCCVGCLAGA